MKRKDLDYLVIAAMFLSCFYTTLSGLVADVFGVPQIAWHSTAGYLCAALAVVHLALNWARVAAYIRHRFEQLQNRTLLTPARRERTPLMGRRQLLVSGLAAVGSFVLGRLMPRHSSLETCKATDIDRLYHHWSKLGYSQAMGVRLDWGKQPDRYKTYVDAKRITLPNPHSYRGLSLGETIEARRSIREYSAAPLSVEELSSLLYAAQGITEHRWKLRAAPSAGALYPIELYAVVHNVSGLEQGIYHYAVQEHEIEMVRQGNFCTAVTRAGWWQEFLGQANVCFVLSANFQRARWKYHERTYRYVLLETGHIGQNLYLSATSMGLGACAVGAFHDDAFSELLEIDGQEEAALYVIPVGRV